MNSTKRSLSDHWFPILLSIFAAGFGTAWFIWEEILTRQPGTTQFEDVKHVEEQNRNLQAQIESYNKRIEEYRNRNEFLENQINLFEIIQKQREKDLTDKLGKECIAKMAIERHREGQILNKIESLKKKCKDESLIEDIMQEYKEEQARAKKQEERIIKDVMNKN